MLAISLGASFPVYAETFTVQTVESDPTHGVVVRQTIAHDYVKRRSMMKAKGLLVQGVLQQIRRCDRQPKGWYAAIGGPNASHLTCTNTSIDLDPAFCQQSPFWAAPPANATSRRVTLNGTACSRWSWWEGGEEFAFWGTPTTPLRAAKIFTAKAGFSTYAIDFTNFVAAPPALSEFDALPGAVCPKATRPERGSAAGLGRWGRRAARAEFSARAVANAATAAAATIAASHAFATGRAYFGSINGTTVATATVSFDRAMHPTLSFDRASHPLVDVHGAVAWIVVPRAPRVAFVGVRSARMSGGGAIVSLPISKTGVLSPTPLSTSPFSPVHFAYEAAWLLACDYGDGYCSTFAVDDREGKVASMSSSVCNFTVPPPAPVNPNPRQASSHPHEANFAPQKRSRRGGGAVGDADALTSLTAFVPDLGGDRVHFLSIDRANGSIRLDAAKVRCHFFCLLGNSYLEYSVVCSHILCFFVCRFGWTPPSPSSLLGARGLDTWFGRLTSPGPTWCAR